MLQGMIFRIITRSRLLLCCIVVPLDPNRHACCAFSFLFPLPLQACVWLATAFTWQNLSALPVMAILDQFVPVPDLTVSCHRWRLICILLVGRVLFQLSYG